ncbi:tumor necrosis factor a (TNF superfamily, member 2) [Conger conger]|nr:tumor necrosis factor a (TNF superfamily, member 2) [Conger conger]
MEAARDKTQSHLVDVEVGLEAHSESRRPWRWVGVAIAVSLCVAATVLLTGHMQGPVQSHGENDLHLKLRNADKNEKDAIHLEAEYNTDISPDLRWIKTENTVQAGDLKVVDAKEIVIPRTGLYFVYSQASFRVNCEASSKSEVNKVVHISHAVERYSQSVGSQWTGMMASTRATCRKVQGGPHSARFWHNGIYLGAVFSLSEGDRLRTSDEAKDLPSLVWENGKTFFGAFAL